MNNKITLEKKRPVFEKILKFASAEDVLEALKNPNEWVVIDVRTTEEYEGEFTPLVTSDYGRGRIKNSVHIDWAELVDEDYKIKSIEQVKEKFQNVIGDKKVIIYCHAGIRSGHIQSLLIKELGYSEVYNYDESWNEWSYLMSQESADEIDEELRQEVLENTEKWIEFSKFKFSLSAMPDFSKIPRCC